MAEFKEGSDLNTSLEHLFEYAEEYLILISPYIKLHHRYISALKTKQGDPQFKITIVFGKNETDLSKSMKAEDFIFFKEFPHVEIRHEKRLHAKYYANENRAILASMNLYDFSQDNNIEAGITMNRKGILGNLSNQLTGSENRDIEDQAAIYFQKVIDQSELLFHKEPRFESKMLGLSQRYIDSVVKTDKLSEFFNSRGKDKTSFRNEAAIPKILNRPGYCIRTGSEIPFNERRPMCETALQSWEKFGNPDYPEKYCHFSGESSNGETCFARPILKRNWMRAKAVHKL